MIYFVKRSYFLILLVFLIGFNLSAQNNQKEKISGDVYFRVGPSAMPVYPRGAGRKEHWESGINLRMEYKTFEFYFAPAVVGAATFDNPDRFQFKAGLSYKLPRRFLIQTILLDEYALNNLPPVDPSARRPTSGVNALWFGGMWDFRKDQNRVAFFVRYAPRSNDPVIFTHFTKPYTRWNLGMMSEGRFGEKTFFTLEPEIYAGNRLRVARAVLNIGVERRYYDGRFAIGGYYTVNRNLFIPGGLTNYRGGPLQRNADRLFFGFRIPFGRGR